jgi:uncharacterized repeat protein (TIGR03803 family)
VKQNISVPAGACIAANKDPKTSVKLHLFIAAFFIVTLAAAIPQAQAKAVKVLHVFDGKTKGDGAGPRGSLLRDAAGNIYGTTLDGGSGTGTVFKIDTTGQESVLFSFDPAVSGDSPDTPLVQDETGNLYGIAEDGPGGFGVVYELSPTGEQTILHNFQRQSQHSPLVPTGGLLRDKSGNIFGTTIAGGHANCQSNCGVIFRLDSANILHILYKFDGDANGTEPFGPLVQDADGNLYGVTHSGGDMTCPDPAFAGSGCGTVFKLDKNHQLTVLHVFKGGSNGSTPQGGLLLDKAGNIYGTTAVGGFFERGTAFKISKDGAFTVLHRFAKREGTSPNGSLVMDPAGNLFGTAQFNGFHNLGTVFQLSPNGQLTVLHNFRGGDDGATPFAGLIRNDAGNLYGSTISNLLNNRVKGGSVFEIKP